MMTWKVALSLLAGACGVAAAIGLYHGSQEVPWEIQSWNGTTDRETLFKKRRRRWAVFGFITLAVTFVLQTAAVILFP